MLEEINTSLQPVIDDFDRYWTWQHRKARLEADLRGVEAELTYWQQSPSHPHHWWQWLHRAGWLGEWILALNQEVNRLLDDPPHRLSRIEYLLRTRRILHQQIDLLSRQMSQNGDPSDIYHELIDLKKDVLIQAAHPHGKAIGRIHQELNAQEQHLALLDESLQAAHQGLRSLETLIHTVEKVRGADLLFNQRHLFPDLRRPYHYRLRRSLHLTQASLHHVAELIRRHPDYVVFPEDLQADYFEPFQRQFQRYLASEGLMMRNWEAIEAHCRQTHNRLDRLLAWMRRGVEAIEQRHTFLLRKQERLIREAE
jgi:hypothetical protein